MFKSKQSKKGFAQKASEEGLNKVVIPSLGVNNCNSDWYSKKQKFLSLQEQREMAFVKKEDKPGVCHGPFWLYISVKEVKPQ